MKKILIVEDEPAMAATIQEYIAEEGYDIDIIHSGKQALDSLRNHMPDGLLLDLNLKDMHGFDILKAVRKQSRPCAIIVITGQASMASAVEAMQLGANDFVPKPAQPERIRVSLKNALESTELKEIAQNFEKIKRDGFQDFIGRSPKMQAVYTILENAAHSKASVFITGESGTGKELAARAIHNLSNRSAQPLEILNCAAIPHNLLESEIFGHVKGAFTDASSNRIGAAARADGGTLFLDELGEMPLELQAKLLRFIQTGTFTAVGDTKPKNVDVRFICATNRDPLIAVKNGLLREDLYYRLNVIPVQLPPLRERSDDILRLAKYFLETAAAEEGKSFTTFSESARKLLIGHAWPGNVRELENTIRRIVVLNTGQIVTAKMLNTGELQTQTTQIDNSAPDIGPISYAPSFLPEHESDIKSLESYEREIITAALNACDGNITRTAGHLGINPATIHRKQKQWQEETQRTE